MVSLKIDRLYPKGVGAGFVDGRELLVRDVLPGDEVEVVLTKVRSQQLEGRLQRVLTPSPDRVQPACPHFGPCGGCDLQQVAYAAQTRWKTQYVTQLLTAEIPPALLPPIQLVPMQEPWGYRSKMEFSFGQEGDRILLGLHQRGSFHRIVDIERCFIAPPAVSELLGAIRAVAQRFPLLAYNPKTHQGFWRYAVIRSSGSSRELMLMLVTNEGPREPIDALAQALAAQIPALKSFYWGVSARVSDVAQPERMSLISGAEFLEDHVGDIRFQIHPTNFVQPNAILASKIYQTMKSQAALTGQEAVYDLYCGMGLIALSLARQAKAVYGVESEAENVAFAERNAALNNIQNAMFLCGKVEALVKGGALFKAGAKPDLIIVDPPRVGLHKEVYGPLLEAKSPHLLYLSCNPASLTRDLKIILERVPTYRIESIQLFDFFPHTSHAEVLVSLRTRA